MAGLFGFFDFTKPGPGVEKDAPPKARPIVFFEIYTRKFWNLMKVNLLFLLFNLPALVLGFFAPQVFIGTDLYPGDKNYDVLFKFILGLIIVCIPVLTVGPAQAGFTYILRNYAREEHAFIWSDFKEHAVKNFKQSLVVSFLDLVFVILLGNAFIYYFQFSKTGFLSVTGRVFILVGLILFLMMHMYIYPMMVTFKLNIKQLYKNALIFTIIKFLPNLLILFLSFVLIILTFAFPVLGMTFLILVTFSTIGLLTNFYVYPVIKKYMIDPVEKSDEAENAENSIEKTDL